MMLYTIKNQIFSEGWWHPLSSNPLPTHPSPIQTHHTHKIQPQPTNIIWPVDKDKVDKDKVDKDKEDKDKVDKHKVDKDKVDKDRVEFLVPEFPEFLWVPLQGPTCQVHLV